MQKQEFNNMQGQFAFKLITVVVYSVNILANFLLYVVKDWPETALSVCLQRSTITCFSLFCVYSQSSF